MNPRIDVTVAAIIEEDDRFLVVEERVGDAIVFNQPAGHLEAGESLLEAAVREVAEETGYRFAPEALVGVYLWEVEAEARTFLRVCLAGSGVPPTGAPTLDEGIIAAHWLSREQLVRRNLRSPLVLGCIDDFRSGIRYPLDCLRFVALDTDLSARLA
jgi:8-oxo-dGTP pyrophosphatase MutT (NUDIX family)